MYPELQEKFLLLQPDHSSKVVPIAVTIGFAIILAVETVFVPSYQDCILKNGRKTSSACEETDQETLNKALLGNQTSDILTNSLSSSHGHVNAQDSCAAYLLMLALSTHSFFTGLTLGIESDIATVWQLTGMLILHKSVASLCLGIQFLKNDLPLKQAVILITIFTLTLPLGILAAMTILTTASIQAQIIVECLGVGTFLYVSMYEILPAEFRKPEYANSKFLSFIFETLSCLTSD
eukprot:CAMPEP_0115023634 /NCGR_PEP_ID=MMETSP0216-20121206/32552_1 /TAXON_ID=223996 /ORGANISM="Protocruzia adherens, Strain Boccale" /LENGTH=235 /DNA_ID=CAMNT_0002397125 /DNA_START=188 /DNA_END=895 /DNA_ORIENTATION=+